MKGIEISLVIATAVALAGVGYLAVRDQAQTAMITELQQEAQAQRAQAEMPETQTPPRSPEAARRDAEQVSATVSAAGDLAAQVSQLAGMVDRLQKTADALDSRITRSRLAVPSDEERKAQIARAEARLQELRKTLEEAREKARGIAKAAQVEVDEKLLLEPGAYPALEDNKEFVEARNAAAAQARVIAAFEKKLLDLQFSSVVEALPPQEGR